MMRLKSLLILPVLISATVFGQTPTFHKEVAPIIHASCTPCHKPGEAAPFSLITYQDVSKRGKFIKEVINTGFMPPW